RKDRFLGNGLAIRTPAHTSTASLYVPNRIQPRRGVEASWLPTIAFSARCWKAMVGKAWKVFRALLPNQGRISLTAGVIVAIAYRADNLRQRSNCRTRSARAEGAPSKSVESNEITICIACEDDGR